MKQRLFRKIHLLELSIFNNRLKDYRWFIEYVLHSGYIVLSMNEFWGGAKSGRNLILRHDVDHNGSCTRKMFEVEKSLGVHSTYYFRFSTIDVQLINEMIESGFEVGLHFETISDYIRENNITDKSQIDIELMRRRLKDDIKRFETIIGHKINSICSHGAPENVRLGISNNALTEDFSMSSLGVKFEAYDKEMYEKDIDCHIMDNNILYNFGFSYKDNPISAVDAGYDNIVFLSHPNHWSFSLNMRIRYAIHIILNKGVTYNTNRIFVRVEH